MMALMLGSLLVIACASTPPLDREFHELAASNEFICFVVYQRGEFKEKQPDEYATLSNYISDNRIRCTPGVVLAGAKRIVAYAENIKAARVKVQEESIAAEQKSAERTKAFKQGASMVGEAILALATAYIVGRAAVEASRSNLNAPSQSGPMTCTMTPNGTLVTCSSGNPYAAPMTCTPSPNGLSVVCNAGNSRPLVCQIAPNRTSATCW